MSLLANRYAKALFEAAQGAGAIDEIADNLDVLAGSLEDREVREIALSPDTPAQTRRALLEKLSARCNPLTRNLVAVLLARHRYQILPDLAVPFGRLRMEERGEVEGLLETAQPLSELTARKLEALAGKLTGKKVLMTVVEKPDLIGGVRLRVGNTMYDSSVATEIEELEKQLNRAAIPQSHT